MIEPKNYKFRKYGFYILLLIVLVHQVFFDFTIPERITYCLFIGVIIFSAERLIYNRECKEYSKYLNDQNNMNYHEAQKRSINENIAIYKEMERERQARRKWWKFWL